MVGEPKPQGERKMNKVMITIIFGIALISLASAETIYAGECLEIDLSELESLDNVIYDVVGNSSDLEGLTIDLNGTTANICTVLNYKPDSFTIIFIDNSTREIIREVRVGGGTRTKYVDRNVTIEIDRIVYVNQTIDKEADEGVDAEVDEEEPKSFLMELLGTIIGLLIVGVVYLTLKIRKNKEE